MTPQAVIARCQNAGVSLHLNGASIRMRGADDCVQALTETVRQYKAALLDYLSVATHAGLIEEFMEVDGMTQADATVLAEQCHVPRPGHEWLAMIAELDDLIALACNRCGLDGNARLRVMAARRGQSLTSIPSTLQWFRNEFTKGKGSAEDAALPSAPPLLTVGGSR